MSPREYWRGLRAVWSVRNRPCLHPFYCCTMPSGQRWWFFGKVPDQ